MSLSPFFFFFFNDTATTEIYTLSLHDALPISEPIPHGGTSSRDPRGRRPRTCAATARDRKSTRLNSSHQIISYAVFCLKKKKKTIRDHYRRQAARLRQHLFTRLHVVTRTGLIV